MFPPFSQEIAHHYCLSLINRIETGKLNLKQISRVSEERKDQGIMIGSLVCWNNSTCSRVVLYALSGNAKILDCGTETLKENEIMVETLVSPEKVTQVLQKNDLRIHQLTEEINISSGEKKTELIKQRTVLTD